MLSWNLRKVHNQNWLLIWESQIKSSIYSPAKLYVIWLEYYCNLSYLIFSGQCKNLCIRLQDSKWRKVRKQAIFIIFIPNPLLRSKYRFDFFILYESLCSENLNMTNLRYIIENLNGKLSCNLFSNNGPERQLRVALIRLIQGRNRPFLLLIMWFYFLQE